MLDVLSTLRQRADGAANDVLAALVCTFGGVCYGSELSLHGGWLGCLRRECLRCGVRILLLWRGLGLGDSIFARARRRVWLLGEIGVRRSVRDVVHVMSFFLIVI